MQFSIIKGSPTADELAAIEIAMKLHKREELAPVIFRSAFSRPQLHKPITHNFRFGARVK